MKIISSRKTFVLLSNFRKCSYVVFVFLTVLLQAQQNTNKIASNVIENDNAATDKSEKGKVHYTFPVVQSFMTLIILFLPS